MTFINEINYRPITNPIIQEMRDNRDRGFIPINPLDATIEIEIEGLPMIELKLRQIPKLNPNLTMSIKQWEDRGVAIDRFFWDVKQELTKQGEYPEEHWETVLKFYKNRIKAKLFELQNYS